MLRKSSARQIVVDANQTGLSQVILHFPKKAMNGGTWAAWGERRKVGASGRPALVAWTACQAMNGRSGRRSPRGLEEALPAQRVARRNSVHSHVRPDGAVIPGLGRTLSKVRRTTSVQSQVFSESAGYCNKSTNGSVVIGGRIAPYDCFILCHGQHGTHEWAAKWQAFQVAAAMQCTLFHVERREQG